MYNGEPTVLLGLQPLEIGCDRCVGISCLICSPPRELLRVDSFLFHFPHREVFLSSSSLPGCTLVFKEYDDATESAHSMISAALRNMPEELVGPQRTQAFCDWLTERFIPRCEAQRQESTRDQPEIKQLWTGPEDEQQGERSVEVMVARSGPDLYLPHWSLGFFLV